MCRLSITGPTCQINDDTFRIRSPCFMDTISRCSIIKDVPTILEDESKDQRTFGQRKRVQSIVRKNIVSH